jgi:hypothetical protein
MVQEQDRKCGECKERMRETLFFPSVSSMWMNRQKRIPVTLSPVLPD